MAASARGLHIAGDRAYCGVGWNGFYIIDCQSPTNPIVLGRHKTVGQVYDLWVEGTYAFVAEGWEGLTIVDVSQPARTLSLGKVSTRGQARGVQVSTNCVYVAEAGGGLTILSLPSRPVTIFADPASVSAAAGTQTTLTVRAYGPGPLRYQWYRGETGDTSQPIAGATEPIFTTPALTPACAYWVRVSSAAGGQDSQAAWVRPVPPVSVELVSLWPGYRRGPASRLRVAGNLAYIATSGAAGGMQIWDITDLASPHFVGSYDPQSPYVSDLWVSGQMAFLAAYYDRGLEIVDVSRPEAPFRLGSYTNGYIYSVTVVGRYAYCIGDMLRVLDLSDPRQPKEVGTLPGVGGGGIAVRGAYAYLAGAGLQIVDVTNPAEPRLVGSCAMPGNPGRVDVTGNYAYVADQPYWEYLPNGSSVRRGGGLFVIDVTDPAHPYQAGTLLTDGDACDVAVASGQACFADGSGGLKTIDVSHPTVPRLIAGLSASFYAQAVVISGQRACVAAGDTGVQVVDISSLASPRVAGVVETSGNAQGVVVSGQYAYLADGGRGLQVLDIGDPRRPVAIGSYRASWPQSVALAGPHLFLAPFQALDITDPTRPQPLGTIDDNGCTDVALAGDVAYLIGYPGLRTVDVSAPAAPQLLGGLPISGGGHGIGLRGRYACVGCDWNGLELFDVTAPAEPRRVGTYYPDASALNVAVRGNWAYLTVTEEPGLEVIDLADPQWPVRISSVSLPAATNVALMAGSYACVTGDGLEVVDLGNPANPVCVGHHQLGLPTFGLQVAGNLAYVAAGEYGLAIYRLTPQLILKPPILEGSELRLSWLGGPGVRLQRTPSLSKPDWQDVPNSDGASGVRLPSPSAASFFRLVRR